MASLKLNLALLSVLPPLTPKTPVIGPLPKPAAFTGYTGSQVEPNRLQQDQDSKTDFDDPFEPEAEVLTFAKTALTSLSRWISFRQATPSFCSTSPPSPIPPHLIPLTTILSPPLPLHLPSSQPPVPHILTNLVSKSNSCLASRPVINILLKLDPAPNLPGPSKTQIKRSLSISSMLQSGTLLKDNFKLFPIFRPLSISSNYPGQLVNC